jgi:glycosyltransferase involved in cell wall biosynthesis
MITAIVSVGNFNRDFKNLQNVINSCMGHTIQLIIVDDSDNLSMENKTELLNSAHKNILIVKSTKRSPGGARNTGFEHATGETIIFWDSDDQPDIDNIISMNCKLLESNYDIIIGGFNYIKENVYQKYVSPTTNAYRLIKNPGIWRVLLKKELINNIKFVECRIGEDQIYLANVLDVKPNIGIYNKSVYNYNQAKNGITSGPLVKSDFQKTLIALGENPQIKSINFRTAYFNILLSFLFRTNFRSLNKSMQALNNSRRLFGARAYFEAIKMLFVKILYK